MTDNTQSIHILLIEDNADTIWIVTHLVTHEIENINGIVTSFPSGRACVQWLNQPLAAPIALVFLDLHLPGADGYTVLPWLRACPALHNTPVIALTATISDADVQRCRTAGFDGFIGKPIMFDHFPDQIRLMLAGEAVWEPR